MHNRPIPDARKLSVILPCFNGAATLAVQLEALTVQDWPGGWELIVVNNGSTDDSMAMVEAYRARFPVLKIVEAHVPGTPRLGVPHSYNTGIQAATGNAFVFCEADDEVAPGWLAAMGRALTVHDFVLARLDHRKLNADWLHPPHGEGYQSAGLFRMPVAPHFFSASACGFGLSRSIYEKLGPLNVDFPIVHDGEYCWRAQLAGYALHFEPEALVHYREKSALMARFRQGQSWGRDTTRLHHHYRTAMGRLSLPRHLFSIVRSLPSGAKALLSRALRRPQGKALLAEWIWSFGWATGKLQLILQKPALSAQRGMGLATAAAAVTAASAATAAVVADQVASG
ncbi:glycosyltransferase family 2 protein [Polaromonas sp. CG_9.11]|uniref:glycosyltransferase family 2 protein n=1 Tax=Polaromonas sp. CG_9.11 TaxID=2787730 RepID=UPI0018CBCD27|nr:glycosyltransferase family 2 protein [Polaromonas sp. CG_9.11]MBG6075486.1 glycosyltransferase involved in cell wall biosynthesis [Polaromonas sp. CG_9.11]